MRLKAKKSEAVLSEWSEIKKSSVYAIGASIEDLMKRREAQLSPKENTKREA